MKRKYFSLVLIPIGLSLIVAGIVGITLERQDNSTGQYYNHVDNHYPKIAGVTGAPDGTYEVLIMRVFNDSTVQMPLCPSYGGQLHGHWKFNNHIVVFEGYPIIRVGYFDPAFDFMIPETYECNWEDKWYHVTLENNIIVHAEEIENGTGL